MEMLNADVGELLLKHIRNGTTDQADTDLYVPIENFVSRERARAEIGVLKHYPLVVAHHSELREAGSFLTRNVLGTSLLLVRQEDRSVKAFVNMCRHRGGVVEPEPAGTKRVFMCSYHGWTYDRDGGLRNVPFKDTYGDVDMACNGLISLKVEERHGFVWVDFSGKQGRTVESFLGPDVEAQLAPFNPDDTVIHRHEQFDLDVNWKLVMDGSIDILHPKFLHPTGVGKIVTTHASVYREYGMHGQLFSPRKRMERLAASGEPIDEPWRYFATNLRIYPNINFIAAPDHVEFWTVWPSEDPGKCHVDIRLMIERSRLTPEMAERIDRSWEILAEAAATEDFPMEESIQQNAQGWPTGSFLYGRNEVSCQHLHIQLQQDIDAGFGAALPG